ncbi:hypothetical protein C1H46_017426 [Malus baccata]|uniref:Uncharacterized protein n=1 Tax=Malus baccata TaxID=106549 RepID=A0A540MDX5_MALBA|nr:hypothetical protein C1H46_017426 [Malus baccata]
MPTWPKTMTGSPSCSFSATFHSCELLERERKREGEIKVVFVVDRHMKMENRGVFLGKLWVFRFLQIHSGGEKLRENRHNFSCRFPKTAPNVDAQNHRGLGTT